jgi:hypothetical protein
MRSYTYRAQEPEPEPEKPRGPAIFSRKQLARQQTATERFVAFALLAVSWAGVLIFGGGGADAWLARSPLWAGFAAAFVTQAICTRVQWVYAAQRWHSPWWLISFGLSTTGTLLGFWPLVHPWVTGVLQSAQVPAQTAPAFAGALLVLAAGALDYLPEQILTD